MINLLWRLLGRRVGWLLAGALGRSAVRALSEREVNRVADDLDDRLPSSVRAATTRLPGDPVKAGAQALVAGRSLRKAANGSARVAKAANGGRRVVTGNLGKLSGRGLVGDLREELRTESGHIERELKAQRLRSQGHKSAADDALLDMRLNTSGATDASAEPDDVEPLDLMADPVPGGRRRGVTRRRELVQRVQRTYLKPVRPWDR